MEFLFGEDEFVADYVSQQIGLSIHPPYTAIGFVNPDRGLFGGAVFNSYNGANIEITVYCPNVSRGIIRAIVRYGFVQLGCLRMTAKTRRSNKRTCRVLPKIGFQFEAAQRNFFGPQKADDAIVYRLDRDVALSRWLGMK
jgi:hypothetical protein